MIRAFIAIELPEAVRHAVAALQTTLRATGADVTWVEPANLHLTLKFLGNIEEGRVAALQEALGAAARGQAALPLQLEGLGAFPGTRNPRVIWVGVTQGQEPLVALAQKVEQACSTLGFSMEDRPFAPHLTIGRVAAARGGRTTNPSWRVRSRDRLAMLVKSLQVAEFHGGPPALVDHLTLFQSTLSPRGPTYTPLARVPLA